MKQTIIMALVDGMLLIFPTDLTDKRRSYDTKVCIW